MTEQGNEAVNPGQAIYNALSDEARVAVDSLSGTFFRGEIGQQRLKRFAASINRAAALGPASWAIQSGSDSTRDTYLTLNVGNVNLLKIGSSSEFTVNRGALVDGDLLALIPPTMLARGTINDDRLVLDWNLVNLELEQRLVAAHEQEIAIEANPPWIRSGKPRKNQGWKWHRDDWRVKLAVLAGVDLPGPSYLPEDRYGLAANGQSGATSNSGHATYDALSDVARAAVDALPNDVFSGETGLEAARLFVEAILLFNVQVNRARMWSLICDTKTNGRDFISVNVAGINLLSWSRGQARVAIDLSQPLAQELQEEITANQTSRSYEAEALVEAYVDLDSLLTEPKTDFRAAFDWTLQKYADLNWRRNMRANEHRDDWRIKLALITGREIPPPAYVPTERIGLPMAAGESNPSGSGSIDLSGTLFDSFAHAGLTYQPHQIASFYTALQTKGFVILSGISGTGKSKIAQRFADMLPDIDETPDTVLAEDWVRIAVKPYMRKYKRIRLWNEVSEGLPVPPHGMSTNVRFSIDGQAGTCRVWNRPETNAGTYLFPQGELGDKFKRLDVETFALRFNIDEDANRIDSIELLTELPMQTSLGGTAVNRVANHLFLPVRPDWRDGKALIGYHNPLTGEYVRTDFLDFVMAAGDDYRAGNRNAFIVILDEMNLAHVEYYFADVLSVIESGRYPEGHELEGWTVEGIPLAVGVEDADLPERLRLPPNLYIVGTVNMDETTHPFSPKVLDRAFTIELTDVDFNNYPPEPVEGDADLSDDERQALLDAFVDGGERYPRIDKADIREVVERHGQFRADLASLNASLKRYRMHFGYRVFDEIMQFVYNAEENGLFEPEEAFDHAVLMKVLPKFNGSRTRLKNPLFELLHWCHRGGVLTPEVRADIGAQFVKLSDDLRPFDTIVLTESETDDDWRYPATGRRAALMMQDLSTDGFASFG